MLKILVLILLYGLFFLMCYLGTGSLKKNMKSFYSYPDEIQERIRKKFVIEQIRNIRGFLRRCRIWEVRRMVWRKIWIRGFL